MTIYKRHPKSVFSTPFFSAALDAAQERQTAAYDIVKTADNSWRIDVELAGFGLEDIEITQDGNKLRIDVKQDTEDQADETVDYLRRGRETRPSKLEFALGDHIDVAAATLDKGLLTVTLERQLPEELQPRKIAVAAA